MINLAVIGLGNVGRLESDICSNYTDVTLVAGADPAVDARDEYRKTFSVPVYKKYENMLDEELLDAVIVTTPHTQHFPPVYACLKRDIEVFVEKPMVTDVEKAITLVSLANERNRVLQVGYQRHFHPAYQRIKDLIDDGELGRIHTVNCYLGQDWIGQISGTWRGKKPLSGGGQLYDSGTHLIDSLLWTTSTEPRSVTSSIDYQNHDLDVNSAITATLTRDSRNIVANITITGDGTSAGRPEEGIYVWGTKGRLVYENEDLHVYDKNANDPPSPRKVDVDPTPSVREITDRELTNFFGAVRGEHEPAVPGTVGLAVTAMTEAIYQSNETGRRTNVESMVEEHRTDDSLS